MNKLIALSLSMFLFGCANSLGYGPQNSHEYGSFAQKVTDYSELTSGCDRDDIVDIHCLYSHKGEAMNVETGETYLLGNTWHKESLGQGFDPAAEFTNELISGCIRNTGGHCVITRFGYDDVDIIYFASHEELLTSIKNAKEEAKKVEDEKKLAAIYALKQRCIEYGFSGDNNIAACIQREAQHDLELERKEYEISLLTQKTEKTPSPFWVGVLEELADAYQMASIVTVINNKQRRNIYRYCRPNC